MVRLTPVRHKIGALLSLSLLPNRTGGRSLSDSFLLTEKAKYDIIKSNEKLKGKDMSQEKLRRLHLIYGIVLSCIIIVTGICFIFSCLDIYKSGERPFTYESINSHFMAIIVPVILCIVGIVGGMILSFFPLDVVKNKGIIDTGITVKKMTTYKSCRGDIGNSIRKEHKLRKNAAIFTLTVNLICIAISLAYGLNKNNFPAIDINGEMINAMLLIIPCTVVALASIYASYLIRKSSYSRELQITKNALKEAKKKSYSKVTRATLTGFSSAPKKLNCRTRLYCKFETESTLEAPTKIKKALNEPDSVLSYKTMLGARLTILVLAVAFIIIGAFNGGMADVLRKAVNICTECIGLG